MLRIIRRICANVCLVWAIAVGVGGTSPSAAAEALDASDVVSLHPTEHFSVKLGKTFSTALWYREVMRQALLISARAEMGLPISDAAVGERIPNDDPRALHLHCHGAMDTRIKLEQGPPGERRDIWTVRFKDDTEWPVHRRWLERMEALSRSGFVEALEKAGFSRQQPATPKDSRAPLEPELIGMIDEQLTFESQFLAIRQLHQSIAEDGETRARLGGLVRAYTNLGLLTEYQWHPMAYAFKARALLYAQRWTVRDPKSPLALQHRAYAFALVGMHAEALKDLEVAEQMVAQAQTDSPSPDWVPLIDAFCRYDSPKVDELRKEDRLQSLGALLGFLCREHEGSKNLIIAAGIDSLNALPGCNRILDTLCRLTGPGLGQATTQMGPAHLSATLLPGLASVETLPAPARDVLKEALKAGGDNADEDSFSAEAKQRLQLITALRGSTAHEDGSKEAVVDNNGLGWPVLAQLIEEVSFLQTYRRAVFIGRGLGLPADEVLDMYQPVVAGHRLAPFLTEFRSDRQSEPFSTALREFDYKDVEFTQASLWGAWPDQIRNKFFTHSRSRLSMLPNEISLGARAYGPEQFGGKGDPLAVSPHSPYAITIALTLRDPSADPEPAWEQTAQRSPHLAMKLGEHWMQKKDMVKAERFLSIATELDPSADNCRLLAALHKQQGNEEKWLETLQLFLKTPSLGLEHARVQCEIVAYYAERREWDKALPYADEAAQTGARWALNWARIANEFNQNWEMAEKLYIAGITRYKEHPLDWYFFCQRNGFGQLLLAKQAAFPNGVDAIVSEPELPRNYAALVLQLEGQPARALAELEAHNEKSPDSWYAMRAAILADEIGEEKRRDTLLKLTLEQKEVEAQPGERSRREELVELARHLIADIAAGGTADLKLAELEKVRDQAPERDRCTFDYFLGCYLDKRGKRDEAIHYWKQCMSAQDLGMTSRTLAGYELHNHDVKPEEWKHLMLAKPVPANPVAPMR